MRTFNQLIARNKRRKQSKIGRFDTDKYNNDNQSNEKTEYNLPNLRESEKERKINEIRIKLKRKNMKTWFVLVMFVLAFISIFFYFVNFK
jgi:hypothetical protein